MKSFDDALNEHKRLLTESLINFNEGQRVRKIMLDIDINSADYEYYFQAGQQSKQAEVDGLQMKLSEDSRVLHNVIDIERKKCEELQKRIDEAMKMLAHGEGYGYEQCTRLAINILKGNTNEH